MVEDIRIFVLAFVSMLPPISRICSVVDGDVILFDEFINLGRVSGKGADDLVLAGVQGQYA